MDLQQIIDSMKLTDDQLSKVIAAAQSNPMAVMSLLQSFNVPQEAIGKLVQAYMANPSAIKDLIAKATPATPKSATPSSSL